MTIDTEAHMLQTIPRAALHVWVLGCALLAAAAIGAWRIIAEAASYAELPLDCYYYFEMARNLARSGSMDISFEQGLPNKFFPGYPLLLSIPSLAAGPHVIWPYVQAFLYLA